MKLEWCSFCSRISIYELGIYQIRERGKVFWIWYISEFEDEVVIAEGQKTPNYMNCKRQLIKQWNQIATRRHYSNLKLEEG